MLSAGASGTRGLLWWWNALHLGCAVKVEPQLCCGWVVKLCCLLLLVVVLLVVIEEWVGAGLLGRGRVEPLLRSDAKSVARYGVTVVLVLLVGPSSLCVGSVGLALPLLCFVCPI